MDKAFFEKLFKMRLEDVKQLQADLWDRWTWDEEKDPDGVKKQIDDIDTYLEARRSMGLEG